MSNFINEIKKDNVVYDVQDKRLTVGVEDAGKMVGVDENGELTLVPAPSGGTKLYKHTINVSMSGTGLNFALISTDARRLDNNTDWTELNDKINYLLCLEIITSHGNVVFYVRVGVAPPSAELSLSIVKLSDSSSVSYSSVSDTVTAL